MTNTEHHTPNEASIIGGKTERPVLTIAEGASILGVHHATLRAEIARGGLPSIKVGRRILIPRAAFQKWLGAAE